MAGSGEYVFLTGLRLAGDENRVAAKISGDRSEKIYFFVSEDTAPAPAKGDCVVDHPRGLEYELGGFDEFTGGDLARRESLFFVHRCCIE